MKPLDETAYIAAHEASLNRTLAIWYIVATIGLILPLPPGAALYPILAGGILLVAIPVRLILWWRRFSALTGESETIERARRIQYFVLVTWSVCPVVVVVWRQVVWAPDQQSLGWLVLLLVPLVMIGSAIYSEVNEQRTVARRARLESTPFEVDHDLLELAFSLPREEWNSRVRAMVESEGGDLNFGINSDGSVRGTDTAALGGEAFIVLGDKALGPVWLKPRYIEGRELPPVVDIIVGGEPGVFQMGDPHLEDLNEVMTEALGPDFRQTLNLVEKPDFDILTVSITQVRHERRKFTAGS